MNFGVEPTTTNAATICLRRNLEIKVPFCGSQYIVGCCFDDDSLRRSMVLVDGHGAFLAAVHVVIITQVVLRLALLPITFLAPDVKEVEWVIRRPIVLLQQLVELLPSAVTWLSAVVGWGPSSGWGRWCLRVNACT